MASDSLKKIYEEHHQNDREAGFSILERERGELFSSVIGEHKAILDIGCRDGALTKYFSKGNRVVGADIDERALMKAAADLGIEVVFIDLNGDWHELHGRRFDYVVAGEVVEHLYYPEHVFEKICRHLVPSGALVGSVPNAFSLKNRIRLAMSKKKNTPLADPTHINHFSMRELTVLGQSFFEEVEIIGLGRFRHLARMFPGWFAFDLAFVCKRPRKKDIAIIHPDE